MKQTLLFLLILMLSTCPAKAQVSISNDNSLPHNSAMLEVKSDSRGVLVTRLSAEDIMLISSPANGLLVFCTTNNKFYVFDAALNLWHEIAYGPGTIAPGGNFTAGIATGNQVIGYGHIPQTLIATAPTGGSGVYSYQWQSSLMCDSFFDIYTELSLEYQPGPLTQTTCYRLKQIDTQFHDTLFTNIITVNVSPQMIAGTAAEDQVIGYGDVPLPLHATAPSGGSGNYAYQWQMCFAPDSFFDIFMEVSLGYQPESATQTTYYRLRQVDTQFHDTVFTNVLTVTVLPPLLPGTAAANQWVCPGAVPAMLHATAPSGGSGNYAYQWQMCFAPDSFFDIFMEVSLGYQPDPVTQTTYYRLRQVDSQFLDTVYTNVVTIGLYPPVVAGMADPNQNVCMGDLPVMLHSTPPSGGSGNFQYQWQSGYSISSFFDIFTEISLNYQPGPALQTTLYRLRQVDALCQDTVYTNIVTVMVSPPMTPGTAAVSQTLCAGAIPAMLHATPPSGGSGNYLFQWQSGFAIDSFFDVFGEISLDLQPGPANQTTYYRLRQVDPVCHDTVYTNVIIITVYPPLVPGLAGDFQIIGYNTAPLPISTQPTLGGSGNVVYQWKYHECDCGPMPCDSLVCGPGCSGAPWLLIPGATNTVYNPGTLDHGKCYRVYSTDVTCNSTVGSNYVHIYVAAQLLPGTATGNQIVCHGTIPSILHATPPTGGSGTYVYQWQRSFNISSFFDIFTELSLDYQPGPADQTTYYRLRQVDTQYHDTVHTNTLTVELLPLIEPGTAGPPQTIPYNTQPALLTGTPPTQGCGSFSYQWQSGYSISSFFDIFAEVSLSYQPGQLTETTYYRLRQVDDIGHDTVYTNSVTINVLPPPWSCGDPLAINHVAGAVAPVNKNVLYSTVTNIPGEPAKCWITRNLGASQQATAVNDPTELSAGWYWQFNRKQGYMHDGSARIPASAWTGSINENLNWQPANDPCTIELGSGWRVPTATEWINVDAAGPWTNWNGPWSSALKLHGGGYLYSGDGGLYNRGGYGYFWGNQQSDNANASNLYFTSGTCYIPSNPKSSGYSVRCIKE